MLNVLVLTTGPLFTLEEAKQHLRVDTSDEDVLIESYSDAAVLFVLNHCGIQLVPTAEESTFKAAALLVLQDLYDRRTPDLSVGSPVYNLLASYRSAFV